MVDGSEPYEVEIQLASGEEIAVHTCDCPYDWGEYCKHEIAVLMAIREHKKTGTVLPDGRQKKRRGLAALLEERTREELVELVVSLSREYSLYQDIQYYFDEEE